ncbi:MAG TPA: glycosyltransferase [Gammaproteobacteria bacterium]|nr:glycosyltransferase [Gammaproteobacteria bacterium]
MSTRIEFMGCPIDSMTMEGTVDQVLDWCSESTPQSRTLITLNAGILMNMRSDAKFEHACTSGDLIVADGVPVVWSTKLLKTPLAGRVAGVDLMEELLNAGNECGLKIYLLGAKQEVIDTLSQKIRKEHPNLEIVGSRNGYFSEKDDQEVVQNIRESGANILFIGMPSPFKEVWGEKYREQLGVNVIFGVGGSFDVLAGYVTRAPQWMQKSGLEWAWRLGMEPRKMWKRYLVTNTQFLYQLGRAFFRIRILGNPLKPGHAQR